MRIFKDFNEAHKEVERELLHNGIVYQTKTVQDKEVENDPGFKTKELLGYTFMVKSPDVQSFISAQNLNHEWLLAEAEERLNKERSNPGSAYLKREEIWKEFLHDNKFSYTYSERIGDQVDDVIALLEKNPSSRHGIISIYNSEVDNLRRDGSVRVPCSMYYMLFNRQVEGKTYTHMIYNIRSNDFATHFPYDIVLARGIQEYVASMLGTEPGDFIYQSGSLHMFQKDSKEIF